MATGGISSPAASRELVIQFFGRASIYMVGRSNIRSRRSDAFWHRCRRHGVATGHSRLRRTTALALATVRRCLRWSSRVRFHSTPIRRPSRVMRLLPCQWHACSQPSDFPAWAVAPGHHARSDHPRLGAERLSIYRNQSRSWSPIRGNFTCRLRERQSVRFDSYPLHSLGRTRHRALCRRACDAGLMGRTAPNSSGPGVVECADCWSHTHRICKRACGWRAGS